jgi:hypothetical protein
MKMASSKLKHAAVFSKILCMIKLCWNKTIKAISLQAWTGPEVSRRLRLPDFKTFGT